MARAAFGYQAVAPRDYRPGAVPPSRLPLDSPTLLTRRRYSPEGGSLTGYEVVGVIGDRITTVLGPHRRPYALSPVLKNYVGSDVGTFAGGLVVHEGQPDAFARWITYGRNLLVGIAHRSPGNPAPAPAVPRSLNAVQPDFRQRSRRYGLAFQLESPTTQQVWPSIGQWRAQQGG